MGEDETSAPENGRTIEIGTSQDPIFVDATGRRARVVRRVGYLLTGLCATYTIVLGLSLAGVTSIAPNTLVPLPGVPSEPLTSRTATETEVGTPAARSGAQTLTDAGPATTDAIPGASSGLPDTPTPASDGRAGTAGAGNAAAGGAAPGPGKTAAPAPVPAPSPAQSKPDPSPPAQDPGAAGPGAAGPGAAGPGAAGPGAGGDDAAGPADGTLTGAFPVGDTIAVTHTV